MIDIHILVLYYLWYKYRSQNLFSIYFVTFLKHCKPFYSNSIKSFNKKNNDDDDNYYNVKCNNNEKYLLDAFFELMH